MQPSPEADQQAAGAVENLFAQVMSGALPECDVSEQTGKKARRGGFLLPKAKKSALGIRSPAFGNESGSDRL